jgi:hypothetical protein
LELVSSCSQRAESAEVENFENQPVEPPITVISSQVVISS